MPRELILHRANTRERITAYPGSTFKRLELDVWPNGNFRICHDRTLGPLVIGQNGVTLSVNKRRYVRWHWPYLTLRDLFLDHPKPLLIDLKGRWSNQELKRLSSLLFAFQRKDDMLCSSFATILSRHQEIEPERKRILSHAHRNIQAPILTALDRPFIGVAIDAEAIGINLWMVRYFQKRGLLVFAWNIRTQKKLKNLQDQHINGAILDTNPYNLKPR